jgi:diaminohydroxyphosphoribosylaminopyrimidine deaminase/5-amino-6-(5-phosphoribosylamino)uracil reductase
MRRALELAAAPAGPFGGNPRVGAVILDAQGAVIGEGAHRGAGTAHAEVVALASAADSTVGATAVVTLEPCAHTGRTGPCVDALIGAGISRVVFAAADPNPTAAGGAAQLRAAGVDVVSGVLELESRAMNQAWTYAVSTGRPFVTWKVATTLDGRIAAADGSSRWITGEESRADVHSFRRSVDAVMVGRGTVVADDPALTVRVDGQQLLAESQPLRVVVGRGDLADDRRVFDDSARTLWLRTNSIPEVLAALHEQDIRHVMLEGGATLASAFLAAGAVNAVRWYVAPAVLGDGPAAVGGFGVSSIADVLRLTDVSVTSMGTDVLITGLVPARESENEELH